MQKNKELLETVEILPFRVEVAALSDIEEVVKLRVNCYGKHLPAIAEKLLKPEAYDYEFGCEIFVVKSKIDETVIGSLRTHANALAPLPIQASIDLPSKFFGIRMVEGTRFCIKSGLNSSLVRAALLKAQFQYCESNQVAAMVAGGRKPIDRMYDGLNFFDVAEKNAFYAMQHAGGFLHRAMYLPMATGQETWRANKHPLYKFFFETTHPDIDISGVKALDMPWLTPDVHPDMQNYAVENSKNSASVMSHHSD